MLVRLPLSLGAMLARIAGNLARFARTYRRRIRLLNGRLNLLLLNGLPCDLPSLLFGEHFLAIVYDGIAIDPGPTRLRRALRRHLKRLPAGSIREVVATHHHDEHSGNLDWLAEKTEATLHVGDATARYLNASPRLPWIRRFMIGGLAPIHSPFRAIGDKVGDLEAIRTPGHCNDHIALYDRKEKILFAGDCFMGVYFSAPNPDVDSRLWIETLERLLALDIEILIEGHGHIHTLRADIPDNCPLLIRRDPREQILEKLRFCRWLLAQIESGFGEGLPAGAVVATCFPWGRRFAWENFLNDRLSQWFSGGHWSRAELVRSFIRPAGSILPDVYEARLFTPREGRPRDRRV
jgi:glyoxylase-like metal-dependent hydrolase (beta-lactamase superfamily II)